MADYMFDTSGLVKYYHTETGSQIAQKIIDDSLNRIFISDLSIVEMTSTLAKKVRIREITTTAFHTTRRKFFADITAGKFHIAMLRQKHGSDAVKLL